MSKKKFPTLKQLTAEVGSDWKAELQEKAQELFQSKQMLKEWAMKFCEADAYEPPRFKQIAFSA